MILQLIFLIISIIIWFLPLCHVIYTENKEPNYHTRTWLCVIATFVTCLHLATNIFMLPSLLIWIYNVYDTNKKIKI